METCHSRNDILMAGYEPRIISPAASAWKIPRSARLCLSSRRLHAFAYYDTDSTVTQIQALSRSEVTDPPHVGSHSPTWLTVVLLPSTSSLLLPLPSAWRLEIPLLFLHSHPGILLYSESAVQCHSLFPFSESVGLSISALSLIRLALLAMRKLRQYTSVPLNYYFVLLS